jgi:hypothetical protein
VQPEKEMMMKHYIDAMAPELVAEARNQIAAFNNELNKRLGSNAKPFRPSDVTKLWERAVFTVSRMPLPTEIYLSRNYEGDHSGVPHLPSELYRRAKEFNGLIRNEYLNLAAHRMQDFGISPNTGIKIAASIFQGRTGSPVHILM